MDCSTPGFPVLHPLLELVQTHVHWVGDAIQPSHPLLCLPSILPSIKVFSMSQLFASGGQISGASSSTSVLPVNIQGWFPLGLTGFISLLSEGFSRVFSNTTVRKHQSFGIQPSLWSTFTSIHDYWKNHSFDYMDLCQVLKVAGPLIPRWCSAKEPTYQCRRSKRLGLGKISWSRKWQPTPMFLSGKSHGQRSLVGYSPWGHKGSDTTEAT